MTLTSHNQGLLYRLAAVHAVILTGDGGVCLSVIMENRKKGSVVICNFGRFLRLQRSNDLIQQSRQFRLVKLLTVSELPGHILHLGIRRTSILRRQWLRLLRHYLISVMSVLRIRSKGGGPRRNKWLLSLVGRLKSVNGLSMRVVGGVGRRLFRDNSAPLTTEHIIVLLLLSSEVWQRELLLNMIRHII